MVLIFFFFFNSLHLIPPPPFKINIHRFFEIPLGSAPFSGFIPKTGCFLALFKKLYAFGLRQKKFLNLIVDVFDNLCMS